MPASSPSRQKPVAFSIRPLLASAMGLLLAAGSSLLAQQPDPAQTLPDQNYPALRELLDKALAQSPRMLERGISLSRAEADRIGGQARMLPQVYSNGRVSYERVATSSMRSHDGVGTYYTVGITQPLFHWGEYAAEREIGRLSELIARKSYAEAYRDLASTIRIQFLRLIQMKRGLVLGRLTVAAREQALRDSQTRRASGLASMSELGGAEIGFAEASHALNRDVFEYDQARLALARLCGLPDFPDEQVPSEVLAPVITDQQALRLVTYFDQTDGARSLPSVLAQNQVLRQSELRSRIASVRLLPKFDLSASTGLENVTYLSTSSLSQSATRHHSIGLTANWNLFDGFATQAAKRQALADKRDAELRLQSLLQGLDDGKRALVTRFNLAARGLQLVEERLDRQKAALALAEENARLGTVSSTVLSQFRNDLVSVEIQAMSARIDAYAAWNDLVALLWLDPALQRLPADYLRHGK